MMTAQHNTTFPRLFLLSLLGHFFLSFFSFVGASTPFIFMLSFQANAREPFPCCFLFHPPSLPRLAPPQTIRSHVFIFTSYHHSKHVIWAPTVPPWTILKYLTAFYLALFHLLLPSRSTPPPSASGLALLLTKKYAPHTQTQCTQHPSIHSLTHRRILPTAFSFVLTKLDNEVLVHLAFLCRLLLKLSPSSSPTRTC